MRALNAVMVAVTPAPGRVRVRAGVSAPELVAWRQLTLDNQEQQQAWGPVASQSIMPFRGGFMATHSAPGAEVGVRISGDDPAGELRSLLDWLDGEDQLRGQARIVGGPPVPGMMGAATETLAVVLGPGGVATAFAAVLIAWIRSRSGLISIEISRSDGRKMRFDAKNAKALPAARVDELVREVAGLAAAAGPKADDRAPGSIPER